MERTGRTANGPRRTPLWLAGAGALALAAAALSWILLAASVSVVEPPSRGEPADPWRLASIGLVLLAIGAAGAWCAATQLARWRHADRLREARAETHAWQSLLDVWQWQTDREHHLVRLQPPHGAPASAWAGRAAGQRLWERFDSGDAEALQQRLAMHAALVDVAAAQAGGTRWVLRGVPRFDATGQFAGYVGTARAVPAPAAATPAEAVDAEAFGYTVSHDLRAPLRVVEGFARILKEDYAHALDRIGNDHVDRVLGAAARMNGMIDALLALAQLSARPLARQPVNLSQLALYVVDDLRRAQPGRDMLVQVQPNLVGSGDPTLLRVMLENLLGNAWKYSAKAAQPQLRFERCEHRGRACFVVRDNGAGFDMRFADRLFGTFQRLHSANDYPGTGIGLASVQRIVRRHGGEVWAEAEVGKGASFYFTLG